MSIQLYALLKDGWVGYYWDGARRRLYLQPLPCLGVRLDFGGPP